MFQMQLQTILINIQILTFNDLLNTNKRLLDLNNIVKNLTINEIKSLKENNLEIKYKGVFYYVSTIRRSW